MSYKLLAVLCLVLTTFLPSVVLAQDAGSITGTVRDTSNSVVPDAQIVVRNPDRGLELKATSNSGGEYLIAGLPPGSYALTITATGFSGYEAKGLTVRIGQKLRADATLAVGSVQTAVEVQGEGVGQIDTQSSEVSGVVTGRQIRQLVLNGRNFSQLVTLVPGVSNQTGQDEGAVGVGGSVSMSINGGRTEYNNWELDGGDNMDNGSNTTLNVYPSVDAIAEVKVLTSNYGAQYGRSGSGTVETETKSGTRDFHGDLYEFVRNDVFNARNFFQDTKPSYKKNDYGYTIGGPVFIPRLFNQDRTKTFFFFSEEWRKDRVPGQTFNQQVPSDAERGGDFNDVCPGPDCPVNPLTGTNYPNNQVPVDPNAKAMLALIPSANSGSGAQSFFNAAPNQPTNWREELVRVDHNFSDNVRFFYRFIHDSWSTLNPTTLWSSNTSSFPTVQTQFDGPGVSMVAHLTASASPTLLNEFIASYTTDHITLTAVGPVQRPAGLTMTGIFPNGFGGLLPSVQIQGGTAYNGGFGVDPGYFPWKNSNPTYTFRDQASKIIGDHNISFGAYVVLAEKNEPNVPAADVEGVLAFNNTNAAVSTGNAFADFLQGRISSFSQTNQEVKYYNRYKIVEPYVQDDWHVSSRLTLNLGLRVSLFGTYREKYKRAYSFQPGAFDPAQAAQVDVNGDVTGQAGALVPGIGNPFNGQVQCGATGVPVGCMKGHLFNPAPRVGFAWDPMGQGKTAIRGGYGVFFEHTNGNEGNTESLEGTAPLVQTQTQYNILGYNNIGGGGAGAGGALNFPLSVISIPTKAIWPYMQQWHFDLEQKFFSDSVVTVSYVGSKGTHLTLQRDLNQIRSLPLSQNPYPTGQPISSNDCNTGTVNGNAITGQALTNLNVACSGAGDAYRPYQGLGRILLLEDQANSSYNALQVSARHTFGKVQFSVAYTWSHSIDDSSDRGDGNFVDSYNLASNRASSNFDQRHLLNISWVYDLPFFQKKGLTHTLLGGWQWSGIMTFQTGTPLTITNGVFGDNAGVANSLGAGSYPDVVGDAHASISNPNTLGVLGPLLFNPSAFAAPTGLTFGDAGRNVLNNPSRTNFDMGLFKEFALTESKMFEFRAEAYNVFNHTQWNGINNGINCYGPDNNNAGDASCVSTASFLHPSGAHNPRILQLGMKFIF